MSDVQDNLRAELHMAKERGIIRAFALRPHGRATLYLPSEGSGKMYTTSTLDTLTKLSSLYREKR